MSSIRCSQLRKANSMYSSVSRHFLPSFRQSVPFGKTNKFRCVSSFSAKRNNEHRHRFSAPIAPTECFPNRLCTRRRSTLQLLQELVRTDVLRPDRAQERVAKRLDRLQTALADYDNSILFQSQGEPEKEENYDGKESLSDSGGREDQDETKTNTKTEQVDDNNSNRESSSESSSGDPLPPPVPKLQIPRGLYIHGNVGTGKTMLMDSFYETVQLPGEGRKQRFHFHDFLSQIHESIHRLKQKDLQERGRNFSVDTSLSNNPIHKVGLQIASNLSLLCLDEFQVTDIADAVILSQLFSVLFQRGTVVVATSNRPPKDLYEGGLNRSYFLPFIDILQHHCITYHIPSERDYRRILSNCSSFFIHLPDEADGPVDTLVEEIAGELLTSDNDDNCSGDNGGYQSIQLPVGFSRTMLVEKVYHRNVDGRRKPSIGRFLFEELCDNDLGATDYRAIANAFEIVTVENIPTMDLEGHNRARRFITLIDELYEGKCALICSTLQAKTPRELFQKTGTTTDKSANASAGENNRDGDLGGAQNDNDNDNDNDNGGDANPDSEIFGIDVAQEGGTPVGALASVRELSFAFKRSSSRIFEMCSRSWWDRVLDSSVSHQHKDQKE